MHPNEDIVRYTMENIFSEEGRKYFSKDVIWRILGNDLVSPESGGSYRGMDALVEFFSGLGGIVEDLVPLGVVSVAANDDLAVSIHRESFKLDGKQYDAEETLVWHFKDGKIVEVWDYNRIAHLEMVRQGDRGDTGF